MEDTQANPRAGLRRYCIRQQVRQEMVEEYKQSHAAVWPEMLRALKHAGWHNYSLFLAPDGLLIGYVESPNLDKALDEMSQTEVNARWQAAMGHFFDSGSTPDQGFVQLQEVFHLETQLEQVEAVSNEKEERH